MTAAPSSPELTATDIVKCLPDTLGGGCIVFAVRLVAGVGTGTAESADVRVEGTEAENWNE